MSQDKAMPVVAVFLTHHIVVAVEVGLVLWGLML